MVNVKTFLCIDLKSFYASVECVDRGLDSLTTKLVVADPSRGNGAICLAVSPKLKELGVKNRCRIFEIPKNISYICALPRMKRYMEVSAKIYSIYLKYISKDDIHVYSIDECFLDVSNYLTMYKMDAFELARLIIDDVINTTGICATCGIGTNLYLAKIALDISAKHVSDHIGYLDEEKFKKELWHHTPITDFWSISYGTARRLMKYNVYDMYGITQLDEDIIYKEFGINGEILIDHAYGIEPVEISDIKKYKRKSNSLSNGQVLFKDTPYDESFIIFKEMVDQLCLELVEKGLVCGSIAIYVGYSKDVIKPTGGSKRLGELTNSLKALMPLFIDLFEKTTNKDVMIRRINIGVANVLDEDFKTIDLFTDVVGDEKEHNIQEALINIKKKYGKNSILKGMNYLEGATQRKRNTLIGGHNSGEETNN